MLNPAPVVNTPNTYVNSSNFFAPYTPPANAVIKYLSGPEPVRQRQHQRDLRDLHAAGHVALL